LIDKSGDEEQEESFEMVVANCKILISLAGGILA
jgi:hypothetical protein